MALSHMYIDSISEETDYCQRRIAMKKLLIPLLTVVLLGVAGCGAADAPAETESSVSVASAEPAPQPELATSLEDVVGTWEGTIGGGGYIRIEEDGAFSKWQRCCLDPDDLEDEPNVTAEVRFEGTRFFITETASDIGTGEICDNPGIYEVQLLADGHLKFVAIEDECERRANPLQGAEGISVEWKPFP
jgi:hypothetical protein